MYDKLRKDAEIIINEAITEVLPDKAVKEALKDFKKPEGKLIMVAVGKAAYTMGKTAAEIVDIDGGIIISKYNHIKSPVENIICEEAGHPVLDQNGIDATKTAIELVSNLTDKDEVLFLLSGGASALFEAPLIPLKDLQNINTQLLNCGADITEINTIRKRLSKVKGGKFGNLCKPAKVYSIILSDVVGDQLDMIGSGPTAIDTSTCEDAKKIVEKYHLILKDDALYYLNKETPKDIDNAENNVVGSVRQLCEAAKKSAERLGYDTEILSDHIDGEARIAGKELGKFVSQTYSNYKKPTAYIEGGETTVTIKGNGLGGRNQEIALAATREISNKPIAIFSIGSDGTDGPTDAAGGYIDGSSLSRFENLGIYYREYLDNNDSYHALEKIDGLIITGPTGTNVNDLTVALILPEQ